MTDKADDVARGIREKYIKQVPDDPHFFMHYELVNAIAAALREYGDERAIKQLKVDQIYLDAERKKADADGYRRGWKEREELMLKGYEESKQRGDRQGGGE